MKEILVIHRTFKLMALFLLAILIGSSHALYANELSGADVSLVPSKVTLREVLEEADTKNPELTAASKRWEFEKAKIWSIGLPDPELGVEYWGKHETWYDVSQTIPFPGKLGLKRKAQTHEAKREFEIYQAKRAEILEKVKAAFYRYYLTSRQADIFEESTRLLQHFSAVAESKYSVDEISAADVLKAQLEYAKTMNVLITLKQEKEASRSELAALLGRESGEFLGIPLEPVLPNQELTYEKLESIGLTERPEIHAAEHHVEHTKSELQAVRTDFLPDPTVQYTRRTFDGGEASDDNIVMVKFNVPELWFWRQGSLVHAAQKAKEEAEWELKSVNNMTRSDLKLILVRIQTEKRSLDLYRTTLIPQTDSVLQVSLAGYEAGTIGFLDLLDSERSWLALQAEYCESLAKYWTYVASLERLIGKDLSFFETQAEPLPTNNSEIYPHGNAEETNEKNKS